jgi:hypothetical protein
MLHHTWLFFVFILLPGGELPLVTVPFMYTDSHCGGDMPFLLPQLSLSNILAYLDKSSSIFFNLNATQLNIIYT